MLLLTMGIYSTFMKKWVANKNLADNSVFLTAAAISFTKL